MPARSPSGCPMAEISKNCMAGKFGALFQRRPLISISIQAQRYARFDDAAVMRDVIPDDILKVHEDEAKKFSSLITRASRSRSMPSRPWNRTVWRRQMRHDSETHESDGDGVRQRRGGRLAVGPSPSDTCAAIQELASVASVALGLQINKPTPPRRWCADTAGSAGTPEAERAL
jgi:hypothetical protein